MSRLLPSLSLSLPRLTIKRLYATAMAQAKYLTGDKAGIDEFIRKFDVSITAFLLFLWGHAM